MLEMIAYKHGVIQGDKSPDNASMGQNTSLYRISFPLCSTEQLLKNNTGEAS